MPAFIRVDLFPASVIVDGVTAYEPTRAIITDDSVIVYRDSSTGPEVAYSARLDDFSGRANIGYTALTSEGNSVQINRARGCGCGSRLRGFNPFPGVSHVSNP